MLDEIISYLENAGIPIEFIQHGNPKFGSDWAIPCFALAKERKDNPQSIAKELADKIDHPSIKKAEAISGFLNLWLSDKFLFDIAKNATTVEQKYKNKTIVNDYSDPNAFKVLHAGHLYTSLLGESICRLYEYFGAKVYRVNFGGDVGPHVAKAMWGALQKIDTPQDLEKIEVEDRADWISVRYVEGHKAFEESDNLQQEIKAVNKKVYEIHSNNDRESDFAKAYWMLRQWSYDYFDDFYDYIDTPFDEYLPESLTGPVGLKIVNEQLEKGVYTKSDGAIIFEGEKYGLHNRVFINSEGFPTYEAKDIGLTFVKWDKYKFDETVIITGSDIIEYMKVVLKSTEQFAPDLANSTRHVTHGMVKLTGGVKMSSRLGNFLKATDVIKAAEELSENKDKNTVLAAVKYGLLKHTVGQDIHYDPKESTSITGNSGPYLQYSHARAYSITSKSDVSAIEPNDLEDEERVLVRKVADFNSVVNEALEQLTPNKICNYLFELTQEFNRFYENNRVVGSDREAERLAILNAYKNVLSTGLSLLGITAPERM